MFNEALLGLLLPNRVSIRSSASELSRSWKNFRLGQRDGPKGQAVQHVCCTAYSKQQALSSWKYHDTIYKCTYSTLAC